MDKSWNRGRHPERVTAQVRSVDVVDIGIVKAAKGWTFAQTVRWLIQSRLEAVMEELAAPGPGE
ncbi:MAG: hypothetical protein ABI906_10040 [Pseudomonadota bacterium]